MTAVSASIPGLLMLAAGNASVNLAADSTVLPNNYIHAVASDAPRAGLFPPCRETCIRSRGARSLEVEQRSDPKSRQSAYPHE